MAPPKSEPGGRRPPAQPAAEGSAKTRSAGSDAARGRTASEDPTRPPPSAIRSKPPVKNASLAEDDDTLSPAPARREGRRSDRRDTKEPEVTEIASVPSSPGAARVRPDVVLSEPLSWDDSTRPSAELHPGRPTESGYAPRAPSAAAVSEETSPYGLSPLPAPETAEMMPALLPPPSISQEETAGADPAATAALVREARAAAAAVSLASAPVSSAGKAHHEDEGAYADTVIRFAAAEEPVASVKITREPEAAKAPPPKQAILPDLGAAFVALRALGTSDLGEVYEAEEVSTGRKVAAKVLAQHVSSPKVVDKIRRDAEAAGKLGHPGVLPLLAMVRAPNGQVVLISELAEGESLRARIERAGRLPPEAVGLIALELLEILRATHGQRAVHRGMKPANVFLSANPGGSGERVRIADFGVGAARDGQMHVMGGPFIGAALHMPPEQALGQETSEQSDLYGVALIMYEALAGKLPFLGERHEDTLARVINLAPPPPSAQGVAAARPFDELILKGLEKTRERRWAGAAQMADALRGALGLSRPAVPAVPEKKRGLLASPKVQLAILLLSALLIAFLATKVIIAIQRSGSAAAPAPLLTP